MLDLTNLPMALYGALTGLAIFAVFIVTWWLYGARLQRARRLVETGAAIAVDVDSPRAFNVARVDGARLIPLEELDANLWQLGSRRRPIVLCASDPSRASRAARRLRRLGYDVIDAGSELVEHA